MIHLVQLSHPGHGRVVAVVDDSSLRTIDGYGSIYTMAQSAAAKGTTLEAEALASLGGVLAYDAIYEGRSEWKLLPGFDHPADLARCLVGGTGLTHRKSASNRDKMHQGESAKTELTDSMKMYRWGAEGGRPEPGQIGAQPEWFYKGSGSVLRAHGDPLVVPDFADDGGEEPEIAAAYVIAEDGTPLRVGFLAGNEFSDHKMERKNYLYLAPSKLRNCSIGPELIVGGSFESVEGTVRIERGGAAIWTHEIATGEANMVHSLANMEHHHFKYPDHRRPGTVHIHFFGADAFSFGDGIELCDGDIMEVAWAGFGRPLRNPLRVEPGPAKLWSARPA